MLNFLEQQISAIDCLNTTDGQCNHSDTAVVNIDVIDVNDNPPRFTPGRRFD